MFLFAMFLAFLLIALAHNVGLVLAGRALGGLCVGIASLSLPVYLGETVQPEVRGTLGLLPTALGNIGTVQRMSQQNNMFVTTHCYFQQVFYCVSLRGSTWAGPSWQFSGHVYQFPSYCVCCSSQRHPDSLSLKVNIVWTLKYTQ